jgi:8-oxo-dGTP diphosphatase
MNTENRPKVGIGVMIFKGGKVLFGKRKGSHGTGQYAFPGGHLEYMESFESCAKRETLEETGMKIKNVRFEYLANIQEYAPKHYVHIGLIADWESGDPQVLEPDKSEVWGWFDLDNLPEPMFLACTWAIESYKNKIIYRDAK